MTVSGKSHNVLYCISKMFSIISNLAIDQQISILRKIISQLNYEV